MPSWAHWISGSYEEWLLFYFINTCESRVWFHYSPWYLPMVTGLNRIKCRIIWVILYERSIKWWKLEKNVGIAKGRSFIVLKVNYDQRLLCVIKILSFKSRWFDGAGMHMDSSAARPRIMNSGMLYRKLHFSSSIDSRCVPSVVLVTSLSKKSAAWKCS